MSSRDDSQKDVNYAHPFNALWIAFFVMLIFLPSWLDDIWHWVRDLPVVLEVIVWILFLPYMIALAVWESDWQTWLRVMVVILIAIVWSGMMNSGRWRG